MQVCPTAGPAQAVPWPSELEKGVKVFRELALHCTSFEVAERALAWLFFNFPQFDVARETEANYRLVVMGRSVMNYAMHPGPVQRSRPLFPLPLGDNSKVQDAAILASLEQFCMPHFAGLELGDLWTALSSLGLNGLAGCGRAGATRKTLRVQADAIAPIA